MDHDTQREALLKKGQYDLMALARHLGRSPLARLAIVPLWALDPLSLNLPARMPGERFLASRRKRPQPAPRRALRVMTWNIKYAGARLDFFYDGYGDRVLMKRHEVLAHLEGLAAKIAQVNPDILLLQEVDVCSDRSARINQLQWLLDHTELDHGVYATQWRVKWLPSRGLGGVDSGVAILSKYPLHQPERVSLPLIHDQDGLTQYFFLRRCVLSAQCEVPGQEPVAVACAHTSAFTDGQTRRRQFSAISRHLEELERGGRRLIFGGDLNVPPPFATQLVGFDDDAPVEQDFFANDFRGQTRWIEPLYAHLAPAISREHYLENEPIHYSHTTDGRGFWNRKLDYLFSNGQWDGAASMTHQSERRGGMATMPLSDHAPISGELEWP